MSTEKGVSTGRQDLFTLAPRNLAEAMDYAKLIADTEMVPKDYRGKPGNVLVAVQMGAEIGLAPMQAIQNIAVINGRPSLWGDAVLALVTASPECSDIVEVDDGNVATCTIKRRGKSDVVRSFSMSDAKLAGLAGKAGPWTQYPARMRQMRARSFAVRDAFPHLLKGISIAEEAMDIPRDITPADQRQQKIENRETQNYPESDFEKNFAGWEAAIKAGKLSADGVIARVESKGKLSDEMKKKIQDCEIIEAETDDQFFEDYDNAQEGEQE
jgi:hypothetical protein